MKRRDDNIDMGIYVKTELFLIVSDKLLIYHDEVCTPLDDDPMGEFNYNIGLKYPEYNEEHDSLKPFLESPVVCNDDKIVFLLQADDICVERYFIPELVRVLRTSELVPEHYKVVADVLEELYDSKQKFYAVILNPAINDYGSYKKARIGERQDIISYAVPMAEAYEHFKIDEELKQ